MRMNKVIFSVFLLSVSGSLAAQDDDGSLSKDSWYDGLYVGAGAAFLRIDTDLSSKGLAPAESISGNDQFKKTSIASKFFAGYRIFRYAGVELGYFKAYDIEKTYCFTDTSGECTETFFFPSPPSTGASRAWTVEMPTRGYTLTATGFWPINDTFELLVKLGGVNAEVDGRAQEKAVGGFIPVKPPAVPPPNPSVSNSVKGSSWDALGAFGVNFNSASGISVRAEIEYFNIKEVDEPWLVSLNALYNF